jgi:uncharacterized membrane protein
MSKSRVEAVSDGVFAIAITLLVLTITTPADNTFRNLGHQLASRWPEMAAYVVSFAVIGIMWFNHHSIFNHFERVDRTFFYLNLALLLTVVFVPYPTGVFGQALQEEQGQRVAAVFYSATMTVNAFAWAGLWLYASSGRRLLRPSFPEEHRRAATVAFNVGPIAYSFSIVVALISAYACLAFHALLAVYYALDPLSRRVGPDAASASED